MSSASRSIMRAVISTITFIELACLDRAGPTFYFLARLGQIAASVHGVVATGVTHRTLACFINLNAYWLSFNNAIAK